jgi:PKD repeat protein
MLPPVFCGECTELRVHAFVWFAVGKPRLCPGCDTCTIVGSEETLPRTPARDVMHPMPRSLVGLLALSAALSAQSLVHVPTGTATVEGNASNAYPWGRGNGGLMLQSIYDSSHFTGQGITGPIVITGLRWRLDATQARTFAGGSYTNATIRLSTCPLDQAVVSSTFALNRGTDLQTVFSGTVTLIPGSSTPPGPGPNLVSLSLQTPFYYQPSSGDLCVEVELPDVGYTGLTTQVDVKTTNPLTSRVYSTMPGATMGTVENSYGVVMQIGYTAVTGLRASFLADVTTGTSPLTVQFTDQSYSSAPGGITAWAWDFNNDGVVDSTQQNPLHTFTTCGVYDVVLAVGDGVNPSTSLLRPAFIGTDDVTANFTSTLVGMGGVVQFTDTSVPAATSWAWDFDGDNATDSTLQNPQWTFGAACGAPHTVTLQVHRQCRGPFAVTKSLYAALHVETVRTGTTTLSGGCFMNLTVTNPQGVSVCEMETKTTASPGAGVSFEVYLTPGNYVSATGNAAVWRLLGTAATTGVAGIDALETAQFSPPLYLPSGSYGLYVKVIGASPVGSSQTVSQVFSTSDIVLQTGASGALPGTATSNRVWNGNLRYTTSATNRDAGFSYFGPGCAGTQGIPGITSLTLPKLGLAASVVFDHLPMSSAFIMMGFSNQMSTLGPLPLDLSVFQAPGCSVRVANDGVLFLLGSGNQVTWNLMIPPSLGLLGLQYYVQALAPDPTTNGLGGVASDAGVSIIGF